MNKTYYLILFLLLFQHFGADSQDVSGSAIPYIQYYNDKDYNTPENQTWAILQDKRGIMYFGNNAGLLEFDGKTWRLIRMPNKSVVRSLGMDETGKIYVGAGDEFGYIEADSTGTIQYYSLSNIVPEKYRNFDDVWQTFIINGQIILRTSPYVFLLRGDKIKIIEPDGRFHLSFNINSKFYVRERGKGLLYLENDSLILIPNSQVFANLRIYVMLPYQTDKFLIVTRENGIYIYSPSEHNTLSTFTKPEKFKELDDFIIKSQIYCGDTLDKNHMLLGTIQNGLIIIDNDGNIIKHLNTESGLHNNTIYNIYINDDKSLWVGLNNGISYIPINSQFKMLNKKNGLLGAVYYATSYDNDIYTGNSLGVFYEYEHNKFKMVKNSVGQSWFLTEINKNLYCANFEGLLRINKEDAINVVPIGNVWKIIELTNNPGYYLAGTDEGLALFEFTNNEIAFKHWIEGFDESTRYFHESNSGNIWISNSNKGVYKLKLNPQLDQVTSIEFYNRDNALPANTNNYVFKINTPEGNSRIIFGTEKGIYKYSAQSNNFVPDEIFNHLLTGEGHVFLFEQDKKGNIYYEQGEEKGLLLLQNDNSYKLIRTPFLKIEGLFIENIAIIDSATVLFSNKDGIIQYNPYVKYGYNKSFPVLIRRVLAKDSIIYGGAHRTKEIKYLPYKNNALQFQYSALFYEDNDKTQYSYYLEGFDPENEWSSWSFKTEKEYTNLTEGFYSFKVKARNVYKKESNIAIYQFEILPPWHRTILAYISYTILILLTVIFIVKYYTRKLKRDKIKLEKIIKERTREISKQNEEILEQNTAILQQKEEILAQTDSIVQQAYLLEQTNIELEQQKEEIQTQAEHLAATNVELEKLSIVASETDNSIVITDAQGYFEWINEGFTKMFGYTFDELISEKGNNIIDSSSNPKIKEIIQSIQETKKPSIYVSENTAKSGNKIWVQTTLTPILDKNDKIVKLVAIDSNISKMKKAEMEITRQRDEISMQKKEITDSIIYSKHIQTAILPSPEFFAGIIPEAFIFYKPKEIIGGDFYWTTEQDNKIIVAVADCTGHGVPGALMSMIGITFLNEIIINKRITNPAQILTRLRNRVISALHQTESENSAQDGMDIALCVIDTHKNTLQYAGANNPIIICKNGKFTELKPDKIPIRYYYMSDKDFSVKETKITKEETIYLFSDGFADQFGGTKNKKFLKSNFKQLLAEISVLHISKQAQKLDQVFNDWKSRQEQVDDVTVLGFKI